MTRSPGIAPNPADPAVRSRLYRLLSQGLRYPSERFFESCRDGRYFGEIAEAMGALPHLGATADRFEGTFPAIRAELGRTTLRELETGYAQTFDVGAPEPPCPPYEGVHRKGVERTAILLEVAGFYRHFGLDMNPEEGKRDLPDHICAELEFLHFLTFKESRARQETGEAGVPGEAERLLRGYLLAQKDFLERHLLTWLSGFADKVEEAAAPPPYGALARLAAEIARPERDLVDGVLARPYGD